MLGVGTRVIPGDGIVLPGVEARFVAGIGGVGDEVVPFNCSAAFWAALAAASLPVRITVSSPVTGSINVSALADGAMGPSSGLNSSDGFSFSFAIVLSASDAVSFGRVTGTLGVIGVVAERVPATHFSSILTSS